MQAVKYFVIAACIVLAGCPGEPTVTSGAGSKTLCNQCTDVIFTNRTADPVIVLISRKNASLRPNETATVHFDAFTFTDEVGYVVNKVDSNGIPIAASKPKRSGCSVEPSLSRSVIGSLIKNLPVVYSYADDGFYF